MDIVDIIHTVVLPGLLLSFVSHQESPEELGHLLGQIDAETNPNATPQTCSATSYSIAFRKFCLLDTEPCGVWQMGDVFVAFGEFAVGLGLGFAVILGRGVLLIVVERKFAWRLVEISRSGEGCESEAPAETHVVKFWLSFAPIH